MIFSAAPKPAVGIDLGTTYSAVAHVTDAGRTAMIPNAEGQVLTPSVVWFDDAQIVVGAQARQAALRKASHVAEFVKRDMGSAAYHRVIRGKRLPPEVIQAYILKQLKAAAAAAVGDEFDCVITVPAFFDEQRRQKTIDAGEMAGMRVLDVLNEPTAAALAFGERLGYLTADGAPRETMRMLVYDLGGGTFDATAIELRPGDFRTLATDGDVCLGGFDWDLRLVNHLAEAFQAQYREDPRNDETAYARLCQLAERVKVALSKTDRTEVVVEHLGRKCQVEVKREMFEQLSEDLLERTIFTTEQVLAAAKLKWEQISRVLLVGGSTRMPMVARRLEEVSGIPVDRGVHPDEAVARGAALFAAHRQSLRDGARRAGSVAVAATAGEQFAANPARLDPAAEPARNMRFKVVDVNSHSLGIEGINQETERKENVVLIPRNTPLPARAQQRFVTRMDNQRSVVVQVLEGESSNPAHCIAIGRAVMRQLPAGLKQGHPVEVVYRYTSSGRLDVRARVPGTDREVAMELERDGSLGGDRVAAWRNVVRQAQGHDAFEALLEEALAAPGEEVPLATPLRSVSIPTAAVDAKNGMAAGEMAANETDHFTAAANDAAGPLAAEIPPGGANILPANIARERNRRGRGGLLVTGITVLGHILAPLLGIAVGYWLLVYYFRLLPAPW